MLGNDLAALFLTAPLFTPSLKGLGAAQRAASKPFDDGGEEASERELRGDDDRKEDQREDDDHRAGAIQVVGHLLRQEFTGVAACAEGLARDLERVKHQAQKRAGASDP